MRTSPKASLIAAATLLLGCGLTQNVAAQVPSANRSLADVCAEAAQTAGHQSTGAALNHAIANLQNCPDRAPLALPGLWRRNSIDSATARVLAHTTGRVRDQRLLTVVRAVATDANRPEEVRLAALTTLVNYYNPKVYVVLRLRDVGIPDGASASVLPATAPSWVDGAMPLGAGVRQEVLSMIQQLAASDPDPQIKAIAQRLIEALKRY